MAGWSKARRIARQTSATTPQKLVFPYFEAVAEWLETVGIGVEGGELFERVMARIGDPFFGVMLNPGHLIHIDEWMHSPIAKGSRQKLKSGMALQIDIIPATGGPYFTINMEDGIALLDEAGRAAVCRRYPQAWQRVQARRAFMAESLGIQPQAGGAAILQSCLVPAAVLALARPRPWCCAERRDFR